ncbi:MAG: arabinofuranosyltransferase [Acidobacteriota bacterium]|jgi:hypothetical protein
MKRHEHPPASWLVILAVTVFIGYATSFLYFFVDDEGIPYVYAQNILHGKGLAYNAIEGRVEGYSDFLHVWTSTLILAASRAARLSHVSVFFIGKALSLLAGTTVIVLAWIVMRRAGFGRAGSSAGLGVLALAGPLAVWSCSSLETVPFALGLTGLVAALVCASDRTAAVLAAFLVLERIDGFIYAGAALAAFAVVADAPRRGAMVRRILLPVAGVFTVYHLWRGLYFHTLVPAPLASKILYKLERHQQLMVKSPDASYLARFARVYEWPGITAFVAAGLQALRLGGIPRAVGLATLALVAYVSLVGDWMFGFRFFVPVLPLIALIVAAAVGSLAFTRPRLAACAAVLLTAWSTISAVRFLRDYGASEPGGNFWASPSRDPHRYFGSYYDLYETAGTLMRRGEVVAYNQAGFVPFMLDLNNIDDLGICSRFHADLPSTDVYFTEVGRYAPLTNRQPVRAGHAYLLYQNVRYVMSRTDILRRANAGVIPAALFGGYYELVTTDADAQNAVYRRTARPADEFSTSPDAFVENLAHVSYLRRARMNGVAIEPASLAMRLPFTHDDAATVQVPGRFAVDLVFAAADERVREMTVEETRMDAPGMLSLTLIGTDGRTAARYTLPLDAGRAQPVRVVLPPETAANRLLLELSSASGEATRARISDLRVQGQTPALARYVRERLRFPRP